MTATTPVLTPCFDEKKFDRSKHVLTPSREKSEDQQIILFRPPVLTFRPVKTNFKIRCFDPLRKRKGQNTQGPWRGDTRTCVSSPLQKQETTALHETKSFLVGVRRAEIADMSFELSYFRPHRIQNPMFSASQVIAMVKLT
jgi:hypothetical protein